MQKRSKRGAPEAFLRALVGHRGEECILWPYGVDNGYGALGVRSLPKRAHRAMCFMERGPAPTGKPHAAHRCGNPLCVNPRHLRWASVAANAEDMRQHGRMLEGARHPKAALSNEDVKIIRNAPPRSSEKLAKELGCSGATVRRVRLGVTYKAA